jgi:hypothetical protein
MIDFDLAILYGTQTRVLNQSVKRNIARFPSDFMFQISEEEWDDLNNQINSSQTVISSKEGILSQIVISSEEEKQPLGIFLTVDEDMSSQYVISSQKKRAKRNMPFVFTEHGVTMLASVLKSEQAIATNIAIVRAFIALRQLAMHYKELSEKISAMELDNNNKFNNIFEALNYLIDEKSREKEQAERTRIGYKQ